MKLYKTVTVWILLLFLAVFQGASAKDTGESYVPGKAVNLSTRASGVISHRTLDFNEEIHLVFLREAEKLERDVFTILGSMYPNSMIFGHIDDIEQGHADVLKYLLKEYGVKEPNVNDNLGAFTGEAFGKYFTANYRYLVGLGSLSELDAFYVSAYIEETNLLDIMQCPEEILKQDNGIDSAAQCGMNHTDNLELLNVYHALAEGSKGDLRAYVDAIESVIGKGAYKPQALPQDLLDEILGREPK
jgi:hypothetical protein